MESLKDIYEQLRHCHVGVDAILNLTLPLGVAYHHAGVNLPARRVIIRTPMFNRKVLDVRSYLQMTGRAGRKGVDDRGESILVCRPTEQSRGKALLTSKPLPVKSCLMNAKNEELTISMKRAILEGTKGPLTRRRSSSMSPVRRNHGFSDDVIKSCVDWLTEHEFVYLQNDDSSKGAPNNKKSRQNIVATQLGRAALLSSLPTSDALTVLADLHQAMKALALDTELHLIYLVTPIFCYNDWTGLDWYQYLNVFESLPSSHKSAANLIGVTGQFLISMASGAPIPKKGKQAEKIERLLGTHRRFYAAMALHDLIQEVPLSQVCHKYSCNRGMLQQLQQSAASFAGMVTTFCEELGWWSLEILLREFQTRLAFGVQRELVDLMQISLLNSQRARALYSAGITSCKMLSLSTPSQVGLILRNSSQFQTDRKAGNESEWEVEERRKRKNIHITGQNGLTEQEAAKLIIKESKQICGLTEHEVLSQSKMKSRVSLTHTSITRLSQLNSSATQAKNLFSSHQNGLQNNDGVSFFDAKNGISDDTAVKNSSQFEGSGGFESYTSLLTQLDKKGGKCSNNLSVKAVSPDAITVFDTSSEKELDNLISDVRVSQFFTSPFSVKSVIKSKEVDSKMAKTTEIVCKTEKAKCNNQSPDVSENKMDSPDSCDEQSDIFAFTIHDSHHDSVCLSDSNDSSNQEPITLHLSSDSDGLLAEDHLHDKTTDTIPNPVTFDRLLSCHNNKISFSITESKSCNNSRNSINSDQDNAATSLTHSQLCAVFDDDSSKLENTSEISFAQVDSDPKLRNSSDFKKVIQTNNACELSPGTVAAMDVTFSPCLSKYPKCGRMSNRPVDTSDVKKEPNGSLCWGSELLQDTNTSADNKRESTDLFTNDSLEDLFACSSSQIAESNVTRGTKSPNLLTLADRTFKLKSDATSQFLEISDCRSDKNLSLSETRTHRSQLRNEKTGNIFEMEKSPSPVIMTRFEKDENLILSSQKDSCKVLRSLPQRQTRSKKFIVKDSNVTHSKRSTSDVLYSTDICPGEKTETPFLNYTDLNLSSNDSDWCVMASPLSLSDRSTTQGGLTVIDVCSHSELFDTFLQDWSTKSSFSLTVATRKEMPDKIKLSSSGTSSDGHSTVTDTGKLQSSGTKSYRILGIAVCWGEQDAYYVSLEKEDTSECNMYHENLGLAALLPPPIAKSLNIDSRKRKLRSTRSPLMKKNSVMIGFDMKTQMRVLMKLAEPKIANWQDPSVAAWMLDPDSEPQTLCGLVKKFIPEKSCILKDTGLDGYSKPGSIACNAKNEGLIPSRVRACAEAVCSYHIMKSLKKELKKVNLWGPYTDLEMPHLKSLFWMELNGIGFDKENCRAKSTELHEIARSLEKHAYSAAKKKFNLSSPSEIAKVTIFFILPYGDIHLTKKLQILYGDLGLPIAGSEERTIETRVKPGSWRRGVMKRKKGSWSTKKEVLEKLKTLHPLPGIILSWRQVTYTLSNSLHPFRRVSMLSNKLDMYRIHPDCVTHSVTGRVSMAEPNIQNVPKPFCVQTEDGQIRIFAHLSGDEKLLNILNSDTGDVFKMIAAQWKSVTIESVSSDDRQRAKQICYGMLYGIGAKALSQQLNTDERSAEQFMESFLRSFPAIKRFITTLINGCKEKGYVETLCGRRRYLPAINDTNLSKRSQAERQAVNTTVQGSAADVIKSATIEMHKIMRKKWKITTSQNKPSPANLKHKTDPKICHLILHLHDELIFEVADEIFDEAAAIVSSCMENVMKLKVKLPVRLSAGSSWGNVKEYRT